MVGSFFMCIRWLFVKINIYFEKQIFFQKQDYIFDLWLGSSNVLGDGELRALWSCWRVA